MGSAKKKLAVDVWSDIVCPWCAIGKRRLDAAIAQFPHRGDVEVTWRAFELDPSAPALRDGDHVTHLARKYGRTKAQAEEMIRRVIGVAARDGLDFRLLGAQAGNTFDAHRLLHLAGERGLQGSLKERFFRGYMTEGEAIGQRDVLARLATEVGLDAEEVRATLESDRYASEVREEESAAHSLGISGVPFFVFGGRLAVSGAQAVEVLSRALAEAWAQAPEAPEDAHPNEGAACGPEGC